MFPEVKNVNAKSPKKRSKLLDFSSGGGVEDDDRLERERVRVGDSVASLMVRERPRPSKNGKRSERPEVFESRVFNHSWKKERSKKLLTFGS